MEIYVSTDVETNGPIPGLYSMLSIGSAAYFDNGVLHSTFEANLKLLPKTLGHPETMEWWKEHPLAYEACRKNPQLPKEVMKMYSSWVCCLPGKPVFVAYPAGFDFMFVYWYLIKFTGESPFSFSALDIKTYAMAILDEEYRKCTKRNMPKNWFSNTKHNHIALDDAIEQGILFCNMLKVNKERRCLKEKK